MRQQRYLINSREMIEMVEGRRKTKTQERELEKYTVCPPEDTPLGSTWSLTLHTPVSRKTCLSFFYSSLTLFWQGEKLGRMAHCLPVTGKPAIQSCSNCSSAMTHQYCCCVLQNGTTPALSTASWSQSPSTS